MGKLVYDWGDLRSNPGGSTNRFSSIRPPVLSRIRLLNDHLRLHPPVLLLQGEAVPVRIEPLQPLPDIFQPDAAVPVPGGRWREPPSVFHADAEGVLFLDRGETDPQRKGTGRSAVLDGVLDEGLHEKRRNLHRFGGRIYVELDLEIILKSELLDGKKRPDDLDLLVERDGVGVGV